MILIHEVVSEDHRISVEWYDRNNRKHTTVIDIEKTPHDNCTALRIIVNGNVAYVHDRNEEDMVGQCPSCGSSRYLRVDVEKGKYECSSCEFLFNTPRVW